MTANTLYDKLWDEHVIKSQPDGTTLLYICLLYTSPSPRDA